jgi:type 1 glutamine amidotransferase
MALSLIPGQAQEKTGSKLKALLITGGCCHNYVFQSKALTEAVSARSKTKVEWTVLNEGGKGTKAEIDLYSTPDWAKAYDVVVHNECFAATTDPDYIRSITKVHHEGVPAVVIHCAMHTYRDTSIDDWRKFLGVTSRRHDHQSNYEVKAVDRTHPIMKDFPDTWTTPMDELYVIEKLWPNAKALATSVSERNGKTHPVFWTNQYGKARVFGTSYGHSDATFRDPVFLNTVTKGLLWASGRLEE